MKKRIVVGVVLGLASISQSYGQGFVTFNNIGSPITSVETGEPVGAGFIVEIVLDGRVLGRTPLVGGGTFLGPEPVDLGTTDPVDVTVRGYSSGFDSWEAAVAAPAESFLEPVLFRTQGGVPPKSLGFPGGMICRNPTCIPEPTTAALLALGVAFVGWRRN